MGDIDTANVIVEGSLEEGDFAFPRWSDFDLEGV